MESTAEASHGTAPRASGLKNAHSAMVSERTNTPIQALDMVNDSQFIEDATHLVQRTLITSPYDDQHAASVMWVVLRRHTRSREFVEITPAAQSFRDIFQWSPAGATGGDHGRHACR